MTLHFVLTLSCQDRPGIVAAVAALLAQHGGNIVDAQQFNDQETGRFFMRVEFLASAEAAGLRSAFEAVAQAFGMSWRLRRRDERKRALILVSKFDHCLQDLMYRRAIDDLQMDVVAIVSNHPLEAVSYRPPADIAFHHFPVSAATRQEQEERILALVDREGVELVILARYMQILSERMSGALAGRCINIHHSFLPGFKGAKPYHQAHARGVKMIGATAHYVTGDLDEGPIIVQDVEPVTHAESAEELVRKGRDIERRVLARAVRYHLEDRVLLNGQKTVVFPH